MKNEHLRLFLTVFLSIVGFVALLWLSVWFLNIKIPAMRHESLTQQLYNRCLGSQTYSTNPASNCAYVLKGEQ